MFCFVCYGCSVEIKILLLIKITLKDVGKMKQHKMLQLNKYPLRCYLCYTRVHSKVFIRPVEKIYVSNFKSLEYPNK